jgi:hypothetical protein
VDDAARGFLDKLKGMRAVDQIEGLVDAARELFDRQTQEADAEARGARPGAGMAQLGGREVDGRADDALAGEPEAVLGGTAPQFQRGVTRPERRQQAELALAGDLGTVMEIVGRDAHGTLVVVGEPVPVAPMLFDESLSVPHVLHGRAS